MTRATLSVVPDQQVPDREQAENFLRIIAPGEAAFSFQTFDDDRSQEQATCQGVARHPGGALDYA
jgi:hypothetical protein